MVNEEFEDLLTAVPGPRSLELAQALRSYESRGVTYLADDFPIFWESAEGALVTDVDGNRYLDLTSAFGVATLGHTNPYVAAAVEDQAARLIHGLGDIHPSEVRVEYLEALSAVAPAGLSKSYLCSSGSEAVDFALKTAYLRTGKPGIVAFNGSYHGLASSALSVTGIERFRAPFAPFVGEHVRFVPFPRAVDGEAGARGSLSAVRSLFEEGAIGTLIVEPIQGRAGIIVPPAGWLGDLRALCDEFDVVLIFDEIYTGFGRTGTMFACQGEDVRPDLLAAGKAIAGGLPLAVVIGTPKTMDAWEVSRGESLHTSTYLGNPLACAAALAVLNQIEHGNILERVRSLGGRLGERLERMRKHEAVVAVRGRGMLWGVELRSAEAAFELTKAALRAGVIILPSGVEGNVITLAPPAVIGEHQLFRALELLEGALTGIGVRG